VKEEQSMKSRKSGMIGIALAFRAALALAAAASLASCVSSPESDGPLSAVEPSAEEARAAPASASAGSDKTDRDIDALTLKASASIDANHLAEGVKFYISALAKATKAGKRSRADDITASLEAIGSRLTLEPHESWLAADGSQQTASSRSAARGSGLQPAVYLYESYGYAKSPVPDAYIRFEFIANEGKLNASVTTDAKGLANTGITSIAAPGKDAVVRAYPIFSTEGYSYAFKNVFRDFSFVAPPNLVLVAALERTPAGDSANPRVLDAVAGSLKALGVEVAPYNGTLAPTRFNMAFGGDTSALAGLAGSVKAVYFALVHVEIATPTRMEYGGKVYNIFIANAKATLRIVRADGTIVFTRPKDGIRGQGGTEQASIDDCLVKVRDELSAIITAESASIGKAFEE
jgi:hypothetical protein